MSGIEMFKTPCVLQRKHGQQRDRWEQIERKDFARAEQQDHQQQSQPEYRRGIYQR